MRFQEIPKKIANAFRGAQGKVGAKGYFPQLGIAQRFGFHLNKSQPNTKERAMTFQEIQRMAKGMDINISRMKKTDIIQAIQIRENNINCYGTNRVNYCEEQTCLWRSDCLSLNNSGKGKSRRLSRQ